MTHAGRAVIVSGSTVAIGLFSMILLPIPVIRSIGIGGLLIPVVSVCAAITFLPAMLALLGPRINSLRVMPKRIVEGTDEERGFWWRWSHLVMRRPLLIGGIGLTIVALLMVPAVQLNAVRGAGEGSRRAGDGRRRHRPAAPDRRRHLARRHQAIRRAHRRERIARGGSYRRGALRQPPKGLPARPPRPAGNVTEPQLVEAFATVDAAARSARGTIDNVQDDVLPALERELGGSTRLTLGGVAPEDRDFVHAVYGKFPYMLTFVILLTLILLTRAFRSIFLAVKAVILNLLSLAAAFGIIVFIFQQGHGSEAIWGVHATDAIIAWIPLMIFAFLYGLSMDYEVFMVSRMREAYDETGDTESAVALGLARTGKLVTSAALVLMFAFFVLSTSPGVDVKQFGIGLAAGIIFDATVIRALLVPSIMRVAGDWNWWLPEWAGKVLRVQPTPRPALEESD